MADIQLPDGSYAKVPDFALESTSQQMLKIMELQLGSNKDALKIYKELLKEAEEEAKRDEEADKKTEQHRREQAKSFKDLIKVTGKEGFAAQFGKNFASATIGAGKGLWSLSKIAGQVAITSLGILGKSAINVGNTLSDLAQVGVGFTDAGGTAVDALSGIQALGFSAKDASNLLAGYSNVVQTVGKRSFVDLQNAFASATGFGTEFGMTMSESSAILAEDLDRRQKLGILNDLDANRAAKRSADLYKQQLEATTILGKSIDDIRKASEQTLTENAQAALRIQSIAAGLSPDAARDFVRGMEKALGDLAAVGLDQGLINTIGAAATEVVAFGSSATAELFSAVAVLDSKAGTAINETIRAANELSKTDPEAAQRMLNNLDEEFRDAAMSLNAADFQELQATLAMQGAQGEALALSLAQLRTAAQNLENPLNVAGKEFPGLAKGAAAFDQAVAQIQGSIGSVLTGIAGTFSGPMETLAEAFTQTGDEGKGLPSVLSSLMTSVQAVGQALNSLFGRLFSTSSATGTMADRIRSFAQNELAQFTDKVVNFINELDVDTLKQKFSSFIDGLVMAYDSVKALANGITSFFGFLLKREDVTNEETGEVESKITGINWLKVVGVVLPAIIASTAVVALTKTVAQRTGSAILSRIPMIGGMFGGDSKGGAGSAVGTAGGGGAARTAGRGLAGLGAGIKALGKGLAGVPPQALVGAAIIGGAILIIGGAIAGATWLMGRALPTFAEGLRSFEDIDGNNLIQVAKGVGALGLAMAAMGAGSVVGSYGNMVAGLVDGITSLFGGDSPMDKLKAFGDMQINTEGVKRNSEAAVAYGRAMAALGAGGGVGAIGSAAKAIVDGIVSFFTGGTDPFAELMRFSQLDINLERTKNNALAAVEFSKAMNSLGDTPGGGTAISNAIGNVVDGIVRFFGGDLPLDKMREFGNMEFSEKIVDNARIVSAYGNAMGSLGTASASAGNLGDAAQSIERLAVAYDRFSRIDPARLSQNASAVAELNSALLMGREQPTPDTAAMATQPNTQDLQNLMSQSGGGSSSGSQQELLASIAMSAEKTNRLIRELTDTVRDS